MPAGLRLDGGCGAIVGDLRLAPRSRGLVLLLHGGGQTRRSWARTAARLTAVGWSTFTYDARGHGDSDWSGAGAYDIADYVHDLSLVLTQLSDRRELPPGRPAALVGASLGGMTALLASAAGTPAAERIVLVDIVPEPDPRGIERIRRFMTANPHGFDSLEDVAEAVESYRPGTNGRRDVEGLRRNVRQGRDGRWRWHWDPAIMEFDGRPQRLISPERAIAAAGRVCVPALLVAGAESDVVGADQVRKFLTVMPNAEVAVVSSAGHMVVGDHNDGFTDALLQFLDVDDITQ